ncbi:MAG TPA: carboxypeptidase regulatory-like domain-containing protein, partial [Vulgatibacter sp.]
MMNPTMRFAAAWAASLALFAAGCSGDQKRPLTCDVDPDRYGGCGRGAVSGTIELGPGGPTDSRTTVTLVGEGGASIGDSGDGGRAFLVGRVPSGTWSLVVHAAGYVSQSIDDISVEAGRTTEVGAIVLQAEDVRTPAIVGTILLKGATDHRGTMVTLDDSTAVTGTAEDGSFRIDGLEPGLHRLEARHAGYETIVEAVVVPERDELPVHLVMEPVVVPGSIVGTITDAETGAPLAGVTIRAGEVHGGASGGDGTYKLAAMPPGIYLVRAGTPGYEPKVYEGVVVNPGEATALDVLLDRQILPATLSGVARRMHSAPGTDEGIVVTLVGADVETQTKPDGSWTIDDVLPGLYDVSFTDAWMPGVTIAGVAVTAEVRNEVPPVELGPATKIADGTTLYSRVFPANRKALVTLQGDPSTYLFDGASGALRRVADEPLEAIAVDADERYATLYSGRSLFRLDLEDGVVEPVSATVPRQLISDRSLTIFIDHDERLYLLRAGDLEAEPRDRVMSGASLSFGPPIDAARGWNFVRVGWTGDMPVDFDGGWAGPIGSALVGATTGTMVIFTQGSWQGGRYEWELHWVDMAARTAERITSSAWSTGTSDGRTLLFPHDPIEDTWSISSLDLGTGAVTLLETRVAEDFWFSGGAMVVKKGGQILWLTGDPSTRGVLCASPSAEIFRAPVFGCLENRTLRVFDPATGAVTFASNAINPSITSWGLVTWNEQNGQTSLRPYWAASSMGAVCPDSLIVLLGDAHSSILLSCIGATSRLFDFVAQRQVVLPEVTYFCSHNPEQQLAVCSFPCSGEVCVRLYDLSASTQADVTTSASAAVSTAWGRDRAVAIRIGTGAAFHGKAADFWEPPALPQPPEIFDCGLTGVRPAGAEADYSLWYDDTPEGVVCGTDGQVSAPFSLTSTEVFPVGGGAARFIGGWLVDLSDGTTTQLSSARTTVFPFAKGLLIGSSEGLLRIDEDGGEDWLVNGRPVTRRADYAGRRAFVSTQGATYDLLVEDGPGNVRLIAKDVAEIRSGAGIDLMVHEEVAGVAAMTAVDTSSLLSWQVPLRLSTGDPWV